LLLHICNTFLFLAPPPRVTQQPTNTSAADPFGAHFTCVAIGFGTITIYWKKVNAIDKEIPSKAIISEERSLESVNSTLFIPNVILADEGGYYCSVHVGRVCTVSDTAYLDKISMSIYIASNYKAHEMQYIVICICSYIYF